MKKLSVLSCVLAVLLAAPAVADIQSLHGAEISVICYGKQNTWIRFEGKSYDIPQSVVTLLRTKGEFSQAPSAGITRDAELKDLFKHADSVFRDQSYDCILAFPASFSYQERLETVRLLGTHVAKVRISTMSEIAALGYNHYHFPLDKTKGQYTTKVFVVLGGQYVSATLAELGYLGVVEVHGSVGIHIASSPTEKQAYLDAIPRVIEMLSRLPETCEHRYDEIVVSGDDFAAIVEGLKADPRTRTPISGYTKLVTKGLLTQSAMLHGSQETKDDLLLVATPHSSLGIVLPVDASMTRVTRVSVNAMKLLLGAKKSELPGGLLGGDVIEMKENMRLAPQGSFFEVVSAFTTIPTQKTIEIVLSEDPAHILVAEHTGKSVLAIHRVPWNKDLKVSKEGSRFEISFDIDANMLTEVIIKDIGSGKLYKHRVAFGVEQDAPADANAPLSSIVNIDKDEKKAL